MKNQKTLAQRWHEDKNPVAVVPGLKGKKITIVDKTKEKKK